MMVCTTLLDYTYSNKIYPEGPEVSLNQRWVNIYRKDLKKRKNYNYYILTKNILKEIAEM
jgi:hypothetical protein